MPSPLRNGSILLLFSLATTAATAEAAPPTDAPPSIVLVQEARAMPAPLPGPDPLVQPDMTSALDDGPSDWGSYLVGAWRQIGDLFTEDPSDAPNWYIYPRVSLIHETGPGIGYREDFTSFEGMIPIFQQPERSIFFADLRGLVADDGLLGANAGAGYRFYCPKINRVFGINAYYDNRDTGLPRSIKPPPASRRWAAAGTSGPTATCR